MKFAAILALALPGIALAQSSTSSSATPEPTGPPDLTVCEEQAGGYSDTCARCYHLCADSTNQAQCFFSVYTAVNSIDSQCWQHGGNNCAGQAVDQVCGQ
ncbi:hypothetical protein MGN70_000285 [Eutypa lata]|uniref:Uncharacterized protein n=1 Tax=Eutypa lata (strain UCR-EL1) TaxID=1287681 RepID=M7SR72_EUTLA|nr:hypothetical protein UCREL1_5983 [Eutypa lata UCREL1]KAI1257245.1 hypothetical protein MGN70_000285 [Eutypa lata]